MDDPLSSTNCGNLPPDAQTIGALVDPVAVQHSISHAPAHFNHWQLKKAGRAARRTQFGDRVGAVTVDFSAGRDRAAAAEYRYKAPVDKTRRQWRQMARDGSESARCGGRSFIGGVRRKRQRAGVRCLLGLGAIICRTADGGSSDKEGIHEMISDRGAHGDARVAWTAGLPMSILWHMVSAKGTTSASSQSAHGAACDAFWANLGRGEARSSSAGARRILIKRCVWPTIARRAPHRQHDVATCRLRDRTQRRMTAVFQRSPRRSLPCGRSARHRAVAPHSRRPWALADAAFAADRRRGYPTGTAGGEPRPSLTRASGLWRRCLARPTAEDVDRRARIEAAGCPTKRPFS